MKGHHTKWAALYISPLKKNEDLIVQNGVSVLISFYLLINDIGCYTIFVIRAVYFSSFVGFLLILSGVVSTLAFVLFSCMSTFIDIKVVSPSSTLFPCNDFPSGYILLI